MLFFATNICLGQFTVAVLEKVSLLHYFHTLTHTSSAQKMIEFFKLGLTELFQSIFMK